MKRFLVLFLAICLAPAPEPYDLQAALDAVQPGDVLTVPPGTYRGNYTSNGTGVTVEAHGVTISGLLTINGSDQTWKGIEVAYLDWQTRAVTQTMDTGLTVFGPRTRIEDCRVHDTANGIFLWEPAVDAVLDRCVSWNNGYVLNGHGAGHSLYVQNYLGAKTIKNSIFETPYSFYSIHAYGEAGRLNNLRFEHNVALYHVLIGGGQPVRGLAFVRNMTRPGPTVDIGYGNMSNADARIEGNKFGTPTWITGFATLTVTNNLWTNGAAVRLTRPPGASVAWNANTYTCPSSCPVQNWLDGVKYSVPQWQAAAGYDTQGGLLQPSNGMDYVDIGPGPGAGMVVINNQRNRPSVQVDTGSLPAGTYRLVNACNPAEWLAFTAGPPLAVPMTSGWTCAAPIGASAPLLAFDPKFGVFYVE